MTNKAKEKLHTLPKDLKMELNKQKQVLEIWNSLTSLAKNEWICWCLTVKLPETRAKHISQIQKRLLKGQRRPCCFGGCPHRK